MSFLCGCTGRKSRRNKIAEELNGEIPCDKDVYSKQHVVLRKKSNLGAVCKAQNDLFGEYRKSRIEREISNRSLCQIKDDYDALAQNLQDMSKKFEEKQVEIEKLKAENTKLKEEKLESNLRHEISKKHEVAFRDDKLREKEDEIRSLKDRLESANLPRTNDCSPLGGAGIVGHDLCSAIDGVVCTQTDSLGGYSCTPQDRVACSPTDSSKPRRPTELGGAAGFINMTPCPPSVGSPVISPTRLLYNRTSGEFVLVGPCQIQTETTGPINDSPTRVVLSLGSPDVKRADDKQADVTEFMDHSSCFEDDPDIWQKREELADDSIRDDFLNVDPLPLSETDDEAHSGDQISESSNLTDSMCETPAVSNNHENSTDALRGRLCSFDKYIIRSDNQRSGNQAHTTCSLDKGTAACVRLDKGSHGCVRKPKPEYRTYSVNKKEQYHKELRDGADSGDNANCPGCPKGAEQFPLSPEAFKETTSNTV